eukprot:Pgem_evm1s4835
MNNNNHSNNNNNNNNNNNYNDNVDKNKDKMTPNLNNTLHIVLIDSKWRAAKSINQSLPKTIPRVKLSISNRKQFGGARKYSIPERVSTTAAFINLITELFDNKENKIFEITKENELELMNRLHPLCDCLNVAFDAY